VSLLDLPIPPRPTAFTPDGAPPGVAVDLTAFKSFDSSGRPWWQTRQKITTRLALVHTNGASGEGKIQSQINWANAAASNTHPHYCVNAPQPTKYVPTDREAIGNYKASKFSIVIETADAGWPTPGDQGGFLYDHAEIVARILAYEAAVWGFPLDYPVAWDGSGVGAHTEPFAYPFWTNVAGKPCPGRTKKRQLRDEVLPRARQILRAWTTVPDLPQPPEDDMAKLPKIRVRGRAKQWALLSLSAETNVEHGIQNDAPFVFDLTPAQIAQLEAHLGYQLTPTKDGS
jgi:hypothetical protein